MKKSLLILLFTPIITFAQQKNLNYNQTQDLNIVKNYKNYFNIDKYTTRGGMEIKIGDELQIGNAVNNKGKYMVNDVFTHITAGKAKGKDNSKFKYLSHRDGNCKVIVQSIFVTHEKQSGNKFWSKQKEAPLYVSVLVKVPNEGLGSNSVLSTISSNSRRTIINIEQAIRDGEIINPEIGMTREEALSKLKESKDLMDVGLMTKKEYNKLKSKLTPIIMNE